MSPADGTAHDYVLSDALNVLRAGAGETKQVIGVLLELEKDLKALLISNDIGAARKAEARKVLKEADEAISAYYRRIAGELDESGVAEAVTRATVKALEAATGKAADTLSPDYLDSLVSNVLIEGAPSKDWWHTQGDDLAFKFGNQVRQGLANAETTAQIVQRVVGKRSVGGIMDTARRNAESLVRTSVQTVAGDARLATFRKNADIVKGMRQVSTLDGRTTLICIAYSNAEWDLEGQPINGTTLKFNGGPPRHWGCRSVLVPITKTFAEMGLDIPEAPKGTRASDVGQVQADISFDAFLKRRGKAFQDEVLGPGRADMWRAGTITLRDLVNGNGSPITISALKALH